MRIPTRAAWITLVICTLALVIVGFVWTRDGASALFDNRRVRTWSLALLGFAALVVGGFMLVALVFGNRVPREKSENVQPQGSDPTEFGTWL